MRERGREGDDDDGDDDYLCRNPTCIYIWPCTEGPYSSTLVYSAGQEATGDGVSAGPEATVLKLQFESALDMRMFAELPVAIGQRMHSR